MNATIQEMLSIAAEMNASDLHLTVGVPPKVRVFGDLKSLDMPKLLPADVVELAYSILPEKLKAKFEEILKSHPEKIILIKNKKDVDYFKNNMDTLLLR